ncbi:hypothetical protein VNO77_46345 [Canavalia gladiata]|uniref:Uncharacterized protein n=1 Tax=Canavalia gladiata TaxID=3824 RepID=A0AAN9JHQ9_CANGL
MPPGRKGPPFSFFRSDQDKWVGFVLLSTQFSVFVRDHVGRKVACLPSHPLEKLVARKKRRGREAVYEASLPPVVEVLGATLIQKQMYKVDRCLADPLLPIRVGLTQKSSKKEWNHWRVVRSSHLGKDD